MPDPRPRESDDHTGVRERHNRLWRYFARPGASLGHFAHRSAPRRRRPRVQTSLSRGAPFWAASILTRPVARWRSPPSSSLAYRCCRSVRAVTRNARTRRLRDKPVARSTRHRMCRETIRSLQWHDMSRDAARVRSARRRSRRASSSNPFCTIRSGAIRIFPALGRECDAHLSTDEMCVHIRTILRYLDSPVEKYVAESKKVLIGR